MLSEEIKKEYERWSAQPLADADLTAELAAMDEEQIEDAFFKDLAFGTAGLRGVIGAGTNRMNVYTVAKASQGLANYVLKHYPEGKRAVAISRDSRHKGLLFCRVAAGVLAASGITVHMYREIMPTPCLSFAVRYLHCAAGIMMTASHNPAKYNGYKAYNDDGCQITSEAADEISAEIGKLDVLDDVKDLVDGSAWEKGVADGLIHEIGPEVDDAFIACVKAQSVLGPDDAIDRNVSIVYSPLNGTGLVPVMRVLKECGYTNITVVKEQEQPDGDFPTCPYPNPEILQAMQLGIEYAKRVDADLFFATDPDADRIGMAVKDADGEFVLITGNEAGMLMLDYICAMRKKNGTLPANGVAVKSIVTTDMAAQIAESYGLTCAEVLTGFKYIGETIKSLEEAGRADDYVFGFEESYGYLSGGYVRDKDAVDGAFLICEMFAYYKTQGISLLGKLDELYRTFGYRINSVASYEFEGASGFRKMQQIMESFRGIRDEIAGKKIVKYLDYAEGVDGLPTADVVRYFFDGGAIIVRPSGTEPKIKIYLSVTAPERAAAEAESKDLTAKTAELIRSL
ncbi:MAG: phospho-sugar mutase [Lachnospiraceae bacterium]|nr:phospho-sugar mutase [Lachnospiraceae bacterium]